MNRLSTVLTVFVVFVISYSTCLVNCNELSKVHQSSEINGRTFVHHTVKRLVFLLLPLMFKFGVLSSMITVIKAVTIKGLFIGVALLVLGLSHVLAKSYEAQKLPILAPVTANGQYHYLPQQSIAAAAAAAPAASYYSYYSQSLANNRRNDNSVPVSVPIAAVSLPFSRHYTAPKPLIVTSS